MDPVEYCAGCEQFTAQFLHYGRNLKRNLCALTSVSLRVLRALASLSDVRHCFALSALGRFKSRTAAYL